MKKISFVNVRRFLCVAVFYLCIAAVTSGQVFQSGKPLYNPVDDTLFVPEIIIQGDKLFRAPAADESIQFKKNEFAIPVSVNINPEDYGTWYVFPKQNKKVWLLAIASPGAQSINLILNPFNLLPGAKLFFYDSLQKEVLGAITFLNNKPSDILPLSIINSDKIYCELQMPVNFDDYGYFTISQVAVEPARSETKSTNDEYFGRAQSCNVNINCIQNTLVQAQKNAVCRIVYKGTNRCTGTLINNIENDGTPYVLTAAHCINTEFIANTAVFYFNYESPDCENIEGPIHSVSGASLVSAGYHMPVSSDTLDFALLKLEEKPSVDYFPYYSGWDASGILPDSTFAIHHPQGDIKKISADSDFPLTTTLSLGFDENTHWYILDYDYGTSEEGSSGCGLVDNNGRLIGTLSAGGPSCSPAIGDFYQKFAHSYNDYSNQRYQLKKWLDPKNTGKLVCNAYNESRAIRDSAIILKNTSGSNLLIDLKNSEGWGYISGHNYQSNTLFAEQFKINGSKYLYGANILPDITYFNDTTGFIDFFVCKGGQEPGKRIYTKRVPLNIIDPDINLEIDFDSTILVSNDFYFGYQITYNADTFAVGAYSAAENENTAFTNINGVWKPLQLNGNSISAHLAIEMLAFDFMPEKGVLPDTSEWENISIYPNPAQEQIQIIVKDSDHTELSVTLFDLCGRPLSSERYFGFGKNIPYTLNVERGIYILQVKLNNDKPQSFKVLVE